MSRVIVSSLLSPSTLRIKQPVYNFESCRRQQLPLSFKQTCIPSLFDGVLTVSWEWLAFVLLKVDHSAGCQYLPRVAESKTFLCTASLSRVRRHTSKSSVSLVAYWLVVCSCSTRFLALSHALHHTKAENALYNMLDVWIDAHVIRWLIQLQYTARLG